LFLTCSLDAAGDADAAWLRQSLQPRRHIDAIADKVIALDHHVAEVDADAELHPVVFGDIGPGRRDGLLDFRRRPDRFDRARELRNDAVAGGAEDPAFVGADEPGDQLARGMKDPIGPLLIGAHHAGIARAIGAQDGRELASRPVLFHRTPLAPPRESIGPESPPGPPARDSTSIGRIGTMRQWFAHGPASVERSLA
jgi:hypothetical protein